MPANSLERVGIAVAVPLTWRDFAPRVRFSDWLSKYFDRDLDENDLATYLRDRWEEEYFPLVVEPLNEVLEIASRNGAAIYTNATLIDFHSITSEKEIVILFAHWKGSEIVFEDLLERTTTAPYLARLASFKSDLVSWLGPKLSRVRDDIPGLLEVLNQSLDVPVDKASGSGDPIVLQHCVTRRAIMREQLDAIFRGLLRPGNLVELYDRLRTKEELEAAIWQPFHGVLDLTVCTSTVPADYIRARRHDRLRTVQFSDTVEFVWAGKCVAGALDLFSTGNFEYQEARDTVARILESEVKSLQGADHDYKPKKRSQYCGR